MFGFGRPIAVKTIDPTPSTVAVTVFTPGCAPRIHDPQSATPRPSVTTIVSRTVPPPAVTLNLTVTPRTPGIDVSVSFSPGERRPTRSVGVATKALPAQATCCHGLA